MVRYALLAFGWLSVALGIIGIFLPVLPTTPFLLLATACFARSSPRFYHWLIDHPRLGPWIADYVHGHGIPLKAKVYAIALMWVSIAVSCWLVPLTWVRLALPVCAMLVSVWIWRQKTLQPAR
ncbi:YbaN family protein [Pseudomonas syringae]|nr:YbaN family protein [Pseudomonas syringae]MBD8575758.1 YbaN family protein [Pseudomonas syringae]MBD8791232.1 YbaN family protein [Pseudomonas syringae]MBD8802326.1 YbaN family protein [Pseudomonas syringae]MBD8812849.1 YbaN family protein [Pseudomonas syringae]